MHKPVLHASSTDTNGGNAMSRRPIGETAMTSAQRSRRKRAKARAMRNAAPDRHGVTPTAGPDYPRMLYRGDGKMIIAHSPEEHDRLKPEGWEIAPLPVHRQRPVTSHGALGDNILFARPAARW